MLSKPSLSSVARYKWAYSCSLRCMSITGWSISCWGRLGGRTLKHENVYGRLDITYWDLNLRNDYVLLVYHICHTWATFLKLLVLVLIWNLYFLLMVGYLVVKQNKRKLWLVYINWGSIIMLYDFFIHSAMIWCTFGCKWISLIRTSSSITVF